MHNADITSTASSSAPPTPAIGTDDNFARDKVSTSSAGNST